MHRTRHVRVLCVLFGLRWRCIPSVCPCESDRSAALIFIFGQHALLWWWASIAVNMYVSRATDRCPHKVRLCRLALIVFRINLKRYYWGIVAIGWGTLRLDVRRVAQFDLLVPPWIFMAIAIARKDTGPGISWYAAMRDIRTHVGTRIHSATQAVLRTLGRWHLVYSDWSSRIDRLPLLIWDHRLDRIRMPLPPPMGKLSQRCSQVTLRGNTDAKLKTLISRVVRPALFGLICAIPYAVVYAYRFGNVRFLSSVWPLQC